MNPKVDEVNPLDAWTKQMDAEWEIKEHYRNISETKRKAELMEQCLQKAKKNIELEKRKQSHSNKTETPEEYTARKELHAVKKETPQEYKARTEYAARKELHAVKKETPEEYKARKESQAQRTVKKETPEEYAARTEYMKKKEQLELEAETQRLFNKGEKKHQDHLDYLARERARQDRQAEKDARADAYEANQAYKNSAEGRAERERKDEKTRIWNSPEEKWKREKVQEEFVLNQKKREKDFFEKSIYQYQNATPFDGNSWNKHVKNNYDSAYRTAESGGIAAVIERKKHEQLFGSNKK
jgi:hypothetical protein